MSTSIQINDTALPVVEYRGERVVAPTMTSLELVQVINDMREPGKAELRHDNFLKKIEKVLGADSPKFLGQYKDTTGRTGGAA